MLVEKINDLKRRLIEYATLVESMIDKSIKGLLDRNETLFWEVMKRDEPKANQFDREIDETCTVLIAQFEPVARDLRTVLMILKMNNDLERMADHTVNISESGLFLIARPFLKPLNNIPVMAQIAANMLKDSISAFINDDPNLARSVLNLDNQVDDLADKLLEEASSFMRAEHDGIKRSLHLMRIAHNIERIADLSTNICEEVIYIVEGKYIKHTKDNESTPVVDKL